MGDFALEEFDMTELMSLMAGGVALEALHHELESAIAG